jgi:hypothetical protein
MGDDSHWVAPRAAAPRVSRRLQRPRLTPRRIVAAGILAAVVVAAPAYAIATDVIDFSSAEPASLVVRKQFADLGAGAPIPEMDPRVLPLATRKVTTFHPATGNYTLWVAPTARGGFCDEFGSLGGGCVASRETPTGFPPLADSEVNPWLLDVILRQRAAAPEFIGGSVLATGTARLELSFEDGSRADLPVTWVSKPIGAGFFLYAVPAEHQASGHRPSVLVARDGSGKVLAQTAEQVIAHAVAKKPGT